MAALHVKNKRDSGEEEESGERGRKDERLSACERAK